MTDALLRRPAPLLGPALAAPTPWAMLHGEALALLRELPTGLADALITDEPYSSGGMMRSDRTAAPNDKYATRMDYQAYSGDNRDARSWAYWCTLWLSEALRVVKPGGYVLLFCDWRQLPLTTDVFQGAGAIWRGIIPWDKGLAARAPHTGYVRHQCEYIVWGTVGPVGQADGRGPFPGCYHIPVDVAEKEHQAGKPVALMRRLARMVPPNGVILDCFAGSASTGAGALLEGRRFLGIEREAAFVATSEARLARTAAYAALLAAMDRDAPAARAAGAPEERAAEPGVRQEAAIWRWGSTEPRRMPWM
ncbi:site-specific DNA-methyltransferase [Chloroflexia bacterium SDU3-3]|nr:site-specific DNA-methyltransferase [Chloroflexia bacterium SDU3-3]